jgi:hypothetical protein
MSVDVILTDDQMLLAQECIENLRSILIKARSVHSSADYALISSPILHEIQQRQQGILDHLTCDLDKPLKT